MAANRAPYYRVVFRDESLPRAVIALIGQAIVWPLTVVGVYYDETAGLPTLAVGFGAGWTLYGSAFALEGSARGDPTLAGGGAVAVGAGLVLLAIGLRWPVPTEGGDHGGTP